jgi:formylglycine-generating enzyme required for sulfatase activity
MTFREIPAGVLTPTGTFPRTIEVPSFFIAEKEVDTATWAAFVAAKPEWNSENLEKLRANGLVSDGYLESSSDPAYPAPSAPGVSWYAATAFCDWLSLSLPASLSGYEVRLPTETEWERSARIAPAGVERLTGGLWEWCADAYAPLDFLASPPGTTISSPERSVRGGSWANPTSSVSVDTRASLPGASCSPFVGFRPAIVRIAAHRAPDGR